MILSQGPQLEVGDWLPNVSATPRSSRLATLADREQEYIMEVLAQTGWRVSGEGGAAELLGLKRSTLESRMKQLGITRGN